MAIAFNYHKFYRTLNAQRRMQGITWNKVATRSGVAPTGLNAFIRQFEDAKNPEIKRLSIESMVKLLDWMNKTDLAPFMINEDDPDVVAD